MLLFYHFIDRQEWASYNSYSASFLLSQSTELCKIYLSINNYIEIPTDIIFYSIGKISWHDIFVSHMQLFKKLWALNFVYNLSNNVKFSLTIAISLLSIVNVNKRKSKRQNRDYAPQIIYNFTESRFKV